MNQQPSLSSLRRFARARPKAEPCDLCSAPLGAEHQHLFEPEQRRLICCCDACAILFSSQGETRYRRVPRDAQFLADFRMTDAQWQSLTIPIGMAFLFHSSSEGRVIALYPSPAGATESSPSLDAWEPIVEDNPVLRKMEPDVEALLVNRTRIPYEYYRAPIDDCFRLVGLIRTHWRGFSGGSEVWQEIAGFFTTLRKRAGVLGE